MRHEKIIEVGYAGIEEEIELIDTCLRRNWVDCCAASAYAYALFMRRCKAISNNEYKVLISNIDEAVRIAYKRIDEIGELLLMDNEDYE